jgi:glycosyltransferase involved in cell wall biosynthesis
MAPATAPNLVPTENPLISVVMPCYNCAPYLAEAAGSALGQSYGNVELLLVDDGSTDESPNIEAALAEQHGARLCLLHSRRVGPYPARNLGLPRARGEFIAFLDADDWWDPTALAKLHTALARANADIAYCGWQNVGTGITAEPYLPPEYELDDPVEGFMRGCPWPIHAALVRRSVAERLRGFSERRFSSMDYDFWLRALALTPKIVRVPEVLAYYRWHGPSQVSAVKWRQVLDALAVQQDFVRTNPKLVAHVPARRLRELTEGQVLKQAYRALWKRDIASAHKLFRHVAAARSFGFRELRHVLSAMLPLPAYRWLVRWADRNDR